MASDPSPATYDASLPSIMFYKRQAPYYEFSNFAEYPIELDGHKWLTNEHYFQASKFTDPELNKKVRDAPSPGQAFKLGRNPGYKDKLRKDWDSYRIEAMRKAVRAKFTQHEELKKLLLDTGDALIVEDSPVDRFWGVGTDGTGKNKLGLLLVEIRAEIRAESQSS
jgi:ribA/ribD-fused uncharacterized protein